MKSQIPIITICSFALLIAGCQQNCYDPKQVKVTGEAVTEKGVEIRFTPPPETMYYCPGVNLKTKGSQVFYTYVRAKVGNLPKVDAATEWKNGECSVTIPFPNGKLKPGDSIELIDADGHSSGKWEAPSTPKGG